MVAYPPEPCGRCRLRPLMPAIMPAAGQGRLSESSALFRRLVRSVGGGEGGSGGVAPEAAVLHNVGLWLGTDARPGLPQGDGAGAEEEGGGGGGGGGRGRKGGVGLGAPSPSAPGGPRLPEGGAKWDGVRRRLEAAEKVCARLPASYPPAYPPARPPARPPACLPACQHARVCVNTGARGDGGCSS